MTTRRVFAGLLLPLAAVLATAGTAFAFWTAAGHGTASTNAAGALAVTVSPGTPGGRLYPGGRTDVAARIANPNSFGVRVRSLSLDTGQGTGGYDVDAGHSGCAVSALTFTTQTNGGAGWPVAPKVGSTDGSLALDLTDALAMSSGAAAACQGATFTVYLVTGP